MVAMSKHLRVRYEPRGLNRLEAANYIGVGATLFDQMVKDGRMPRPFRINSRSVWDMRELDLAFDSLSRETNDNNAWQEVA